MRLRDQPALGELVAALAIASFALLACKKSESDSTPSATATATAAPEATVEPESSAAEPAASASAEPTATATATTATTVVKPTTTAQPIKDAGVAAADAATADAGRLSSTSATEAKAIQACCAKLNAEAGKGGMNANRYKSAAAVCGGIAQSVQTGKANAASARTMIRAQLQGVPVPGGC